MLIKGNIERFEGDAIEALFLVVTGNGHNSVHRLVNIFERKYVNKR